MTSRLKQTTVRFRPHIADAVGRRMEADGIKHVSEAVNAALNEWSQDYQEGGTDDGITTGAGDQQS